MNTDTNTTIETRATLAARLEAEGWCIGRPRQVRPQCIAIDRESAAEGVCDQCGTLGLEFIPYRPADGTDGYRCVAWCSACDSAVEF
jgi:hypothetical protein